MQSSVGGQTTVCGTSEHAWCVLCSVIMKWLSAFYRLTENTNVSLHLAQPSWTELNFPLTCFKNKEIKCMANKDVLL